MLRAVPGLYCLLCSALPGVVGDRTSGDEGFVDATPRTDAEGGPPESANRISLRRGIAANGEVEPGDDLPLLGNSTSTSSFASSSTSRYYSESAPTPSSTSSGNDGEIDSPNTDFLLLEDAAGGTSLSKFNNVAAAAGTVTEDVRLEKHEKQERGAAGASDDTVPAPAEDAAWPGDDPAAQGGTPTSAIARQRLERSRRLDPDAGSTFSEVSVAEGVAYNPRHPHCKYRVDYLDADFFLGDLCAVKLGLNFAPTSKYPQGKVGLEWNRVKYQGETQLRPLYNEQNTQQDRARAAKAEEKCREGYLFANKMREALLWDEHTRNRENKFFRDNPRFYDDNFYNGKRNRNPSRNPAQRRKILDELKVESVAELEELIKRYYVGQGYGKLTHQGDNGQGVDLHTARPANIRSDWSWMCAVICDFLDGSATEQCVAYSYDHKAPGVKKYSYTTWANEHDLPGPTYMHLCWPKSRAVHAHSDPKYMPGIYSSRCRPELEPDEVPEPRVPERRNLRSAVHEHVHNNNIVEETEEESCLSC